MAFKNSQEELDKKITWIKDALAKNPALSRCHFVRHCGYAPSLLDKLVENGTISFLPTKPRKISSHYRK